MKTVQESVTPLVCPELGPVTGASGQESEFCDSNWLQVRETYYECVV